MKFFNKLEILLFALFSNQVLSRAIDKVSDNGKCGEEYGRCSAGYCCSQLGWCGNSELHCKFENGCQADYGTCIGDASIVAERVMNSEAIDTTMEVSLDGLCGEGLPPCRKGFCCSKLGWCGNSDLHCLVEEGCQSEFGECRNRPIIENQEISEDPEKTDDDEKSKKSDDDEKSKKSGESEKPDEVTSASSDGDGDLCKDISLFKTTFTKEKFVSLLNDYAKDFENRYGRNHRNLGKLKNLVKKAESIYDVSIRNNINPEVVVVRPMKEGYSPGGSTNNYWGIGCFNGRKARECTSYSSLDDAILDFINIAKRYSSVYNLMDDYSYIGDFWYNPGNGGSGGCYYYPHMKNYLSESRKNEVERICSGKKCDDGSNKSNCVKTTEEDQKAYTKYQNSEMLTQRNHAFKIKC